MSGRLRLVVWVGVLVGGVLVGLRPATAGRHEIPHLPGLRAQVEFWKDIFATYSGREVVIHDTEHLDRVYSVLDFRPLAMSGASDAEVDAYRREEVRNEIERIRALLLRLHQVGPSADGLSDEELRIAKMFARERSPSKFLDAAAEDRLRSQTGLRERFAEGIEVSRRYLPEMEAIFRSEGLPVELTRLPLIESCFNVRAYSKVGAGGIWQFMPATGRQYMRVDNSVDERRDPITSTIAAARHLKGDYHALGSWPLAITAYNHGRGGVRRAVETVGSSDLQVIVKRYRGPAFRFASRNFYAEFLAALEVERDYETYFGPLNLHPPQRVDYVVVPGSIGFHTLARAAGTSTADLAEMNPALGTAVVSGRVPVPRGYRARLPKGTADVFETRYAALASQPQPGQRHSRQVAKAGAPARKGRVVKHRVQPGQTLSAIAKRYGTSVEAIKRHNGLRDARRVRAGQSLVIPQS